MAVNLRHISIYSIFVALFRLVSMICLASQPRNTPTPTLEHRHDLPGGGTPDSLPSVFRFLLAPVTAKFPEKFRQVLEARGFWCIISI